MPEITQIEYNLLMEAITKNAGSMEMLTERISDLRERYAERFLTRDEDDKHDAALVANLLREIDGVRKLVYWLAGAAITLSAAALGGHLSGIPH